MQLWKRFDVGLLLNAQSFDDAGAGSSERLMYLCSFAGAGFQCEDKSIVAASMIGLVLDLFRRTGI